MNGEPGATGPSMWGIGSYALAWSTGVPGYQTPDPPLTPLGLVEMAAERGIPLVQICDNMPLHTLSGDDLETLAIRAAESGVRLELGARTYLRDPLLNYLEIATRLGSTVVRTLLAGPAEGTPDLIARAEKSLRAVLPAYERRGVALAVENYERYRCADLVALIGRLDSPNLGVCLDTVNSLGALEPLNDVVAMLAPHTLSFHLKDFLIRRHPHMMGFEIVGAEPGTGYLDSRGILRQIRAAGRDPGVVLELWPPYQGELGATVVLERRWLETGVAHLRRLMS